MLKTFKLKNGIQVATYNLPNLKSIHIRLAVKGGSLSEDKNGAAHLMEHMLVQGIPMLPNAQQYSEFIESLSGSYSAYTQQSTVGYEVTVPASYLETAIRIAGETFFEALFPPDALEKERVVVTTELKQQQDSRGYKMGKFFQKSRFNSKSLFRRDFGGTVKGMEKLSREDLIQYWKKYFVPQNTYLIVVGSFKEEKLTKLLNKYLGQYSAEAGFIGFPKIGQEDFASDLLSLRHDKNLQSVYLDLTFPSLSLFDTKLRLKQSLALTTLGRLRNSRLYRLLRYQKGLVYDVRSGSSLFPGLGYVYIISEVAPDQFEEVLSLIIAELQEFIRLGVTEDELKFAKNFLINQWLMAFDHPSSIANWIEGGLLWEEKIELPEDTAKSVSVITSAQIREVMQKYWDFSKLNLVVQGPIKKTPGTLEKLTKLMKELKNG